WMVGFDGISRHAWGSSVDLDNLMFLRGDVAELSWLPNFFSLGIYVGSLYYWPDAAAGLRDIFRVLNEGGSAWILINYYRDNPHCHHWGNLLPVPTHLLSAGEWAVRFRAAGFTHLADQHFVDGAPWAEGHPGRSCRG